MASHIFALCTPLQPNLERPSGVLLVGTEELPAGQGFCVRGLKNLYGQPLRNLMRSTTALVQHELYQNNITGDNLLILEHLGQPFPKDPLRRSESGRSPPL